MLCLQMVPVFTQQRNMNIVFSAKCKEDSAAVNLWCEYWNVKINERKTQATYFSIRCRVPDDVLQLNGQGIQKDCRKGLVHVHKDLFSI
jgi:hypothetical protein